jgi:hypothetical protein
LSRTTYLKWKSEAAGVAPSERQVVAEGPGSPRADRGGNRRIESQYEQEPQQAQHEASLTRKTKRNWIHFYLTDLAADHNFGEAQLGDGAAPSGWSASLSFAESPPDSLKVQSCR